MSVSRNKPYAGGFITEHYGNPAAGLHAIQIEINRALYMDERRFERSPASRPVAQRSRGAWPTRLARHRAARSCGPTAPPPSSFASAHADGLSLPKQQPGDEARPRALKKGPLAC